MKTLLSIILLLSSLTALAQTTTKKETKTLTFDQEINLTPTEVELKSSQLVSPYTYNKIVFGELTQLLLGNSTSPSEGIEATFNEDKSNIKLSGIIASYEKLLVSIEGDFSASDGGIYFFDEKNGSKNAKITLNFYRPFYGSHSYDSPVTSMKTRRAFYTIEDAKRKKIAKLIKDYYYSKYLLEKTGFPVKADNLDSFTKNIANKFHYTIDLAEYKVNEEKLDSLELATFIKSMKVEKTEKDDENTIKIEKDGSYILVPDRTGVEDVIPNYDVIKVMSLYQTTINSMDSISNKLVEVESELSQPYWNRKRFWYLGGSPFYEREEIKNVYNPDEMASFDDNFNSQLGDLFGFNFQGGFFYQSKKATKKNMYTKMFFGRVTLNASRGSNRSEFNKRTFNFEPTVVGTIGNDTIVSPNSKEGNFNKEGNVYNFGEKYGVGAEAYWFPLARYGLFGQVGYNTINFRPGDGEDIDIWNLRLGVLINIKSKKKNFATLQLFADRSDLSLSPNGKDNNLRFGFKVGVPFNFKEKL